MSAECQRPLPQPPLPPTHHRLQSSPISPTVNSSQPTAMCPTRDRLISSGLSSISLLTTTDICSNSSAGGEGQAMSEESFYELDDVLNGSPIGLQNTNSTANKLQSNPFPLIVDSLQSTPLPQAALPPAMDSLRSTRVPRDSSPLLHTTTKPFPISSAGREGGQDHSFYELDDTLNEGTTSKRFTPPISMEPPSHTTMAPSRDSTCLLSNPLLHTRRVTDQCPLSSAERDGQDYITGRSFYELDDIQNESAKGVTEYYNQHIQPLNLTGQ